MRKALFIFALLCLSIIPLNAFAKTFNAESVTLDNGLQLVVIPNHRAPVVTHMVWYKVGAADEPMGSSGMAHYFEHLMFKGTNTVAPGDFSKIVKELGGNDNAFTSQDYTAYFQSISVEHLEKMMKMEADRMANLHPPTEHFNMEKNVVLEERRQRTENDPRGLFFEQMRSALFTNHPYSIPTIGWMDEIKTYEWEDVKAFYDKWYAPNNAIVVISGDITLKEAEKIARKTYGKLKPKQLPSRQRPFVPPAISETVLVLEHDSIHQENFYHMIIAPSYGNSRQDALALTMLQEILSGGPTTRLYKSLAVEQKKAVSVDLYYNGQMKDYGTLHIAATPVDGGDIKELENLVYAEINNVIKNGVTEEEVKDAIRRIEDSSVFSRDSFSGPANIFGQALTTGNSIDDVENWVDDMSKITAEDVQRVAKTYLDLDNPWLRPRVIGYLKPKTTNEKGQDQ